MSKVHISFECTDFPAKNINQVGPKIKVLTDNEKEEVEVKVERYSFDMLKMLQWAGGMMKMLMETFETILKSLIIFFILYKQIRRTYLFLLQRIAWSPLHLVACCLGYARIELILFMELV